MAQDPSYSEQQSALILQRAAELSAQQGRNLSLSELESAASEAGIDVALVRQAADEVTAMATVTPTAPPAPVRAGLLGSPMHLVHERVVPGELPASRWDEVLGEIRRQLGITGQVEPMGRQLVWQNPHGRKIRITLSPRGGQTLVRVEERLGELGGGLFLGMGLPLTFAGLGFILPICIAVIEMPALIPVAFLAWAALVFGFARLLFTTVTRGREPQLSALADGLAEVCRLPPSS